MLWHIWFKLQEKNDPLKKEARRAWCKCADELGEMVNQEVKTNPRYKDIRKIQIEQLQIPKSIMENLLGNILLFVTIPFVVVTLYFGTKGGYYDTDKYDGDGTAHKVLKQLTSLIK